MNWVGRKSGWGGLIKSALLCALALAGAELFYYQYLFWPTLHVSSIVTALMKIFTFLSFTMAVVAISSCSKKNDSNPNTVTSTGTGSIYGALSPTGVASVVSAVDNDGKVFTTNPNTSSGAYSIDNLSVGIYTMFTTAPTGRTNMAITSSIINTGASPITLIDRQKFNRGAVTIASTWGDVYSPKSGSSATYTNGSRQVTTLGATMSLSSYSNQTYGINIEFTTATGENLFIFIQNPLGPGIYDFTNPRVGIASYKFGSTIYSTLQRGSGNVNLITFTPYALPAQAHASGTFSFVAPALFGGTGSTTITNGSFNF